MNFGIIGGGGISDTHARAVSELEGSQAVAFYGSNEIKVNQLASKYNATAYSDFDDFLAHRPMDAVIIGSPSGLHAIAGIAAAEHGLHVLVEKPIDITTEATDKLIQACSKAGVILAVCYQDRFADDSLQFKKLIDEGSLGKPILVSARVKWYRTPEYYSNSRWRGRLSLDGGGALINQGIHTIDLMLWLLGDVKKVYARSATALHNIESEDTLVATLEFVSGAIGTLEAATSAYPGYERRLEVTGSEGTVILQHDRIVSADLKVLPTDLVLTDRVDANRSASSPIVSDVTGHRKIIADFMSAIANGGTPRCDGSEGRRSVALVEALYRSARLAEPVNLC